MKSINTTFISKKSECQTYIGSDFMSQILSNIDLEKYKKILIITDSNLEKLHLEKFKKEILENLEDKSKLEHFSFLAGEKNKNLKTVELAYEKMVEFSMDRHSLIINLGGGVVSDIGGFVAATFMRGVSYINIPTTLEAAVDAAHGGKTGVNFKNNKNYIGSFHIPKNVIIDTSFFKTLEPRVFLQGYAEVLKHGLIADKNYFDYCIKKSPLDMNSYELVDMISRSIEIKSMIVKQDSNELALRKILNFGHTVGHVLESASFSTENPLFHGEAVAIGIIAESYLSYLLGYINKNDFQKIKEGVKKVSLPTTYNDKNLKVENVLSLLKNDKKNEKGKIKWTLLTKIGQADFNIESDEKFVKEAISQVLE